MGMSLHLNKNVSPSPKFVPSFVEIDPVYLEKRIKKWKFYDNDGTNDRQLQRTNFDKKSLLEHSAQVSILRKEKTHNFRTLDCTTFSGGENDDSHKATPGTLFYQISLFWGHINLKIYIKCIFVEKHQHCLIYMYTAILN